MGGNRLQVEVINKIYEKEGITYGVPVMLLLFVKKIGGNMKIQDPDELIHEIDWKGIDEVKNYLYLFQRNTS